MDVESLRELLDGEDVAVGSDRPAEQPEVVDEPFGDEPVLAVEEEVRLGVALRQLLVPLPHDVGQVTELRGRLGDADGLERFVEDDLARRRREQILTAQHVRDAHEGIVDGVDERVERLPVRADDDEVGDRAGLERDVAADEVGERDVVIGHPHPPHGFAALGAEGGDLVGREVAVEAVVAELGIPSGRPVPGLDLLVRRVRLVDVATGLELLDDVCVDVTALRLAVGGVGSADLDALVPVEAEPLHRLDDLAEALLRVAGGIGVLDAEDERAAGVLGVRPVEQRGANHADVRGSGG